MTIISSGARIRNSSFIAAECLYTISSNELVNGRRKKKIIKASRARFQSATRYVFLILNTARSARMSTFDVPPI